MITADVIIDRISCSDSDAWSIETEVSRGRCAVTVTGGQWSMTAPDVSLADLARIETALLSRSIA